MEQFIGRDAHKKLSVFVAVNKKWHAGEALRVVHDRQVYREFLARLPPYSSIGVEAGGSYSWLVDEMERSVIAPSCYALYPPKIRIPELCYTELASQRPQPLRRRSQDRAFVRVRCFFLT
jgi:hypothetical protein